jgi:serine/threonine-protein kinase
VPKRGASLPLGVTLRVIADTCAGLHGAHKLQDMRGKSLGIVHRDVSPQNILLTAAGSVKVIDFGIAKATNRSAGDTRSGTIKGKIHYMAPEQAGGRAIDRRADVWSVGVCLYELVTGKLPFDGDSDVDVLRRLLSEEPAPRPDESVPAPVAEVITCSLTRDPGARFSTAAAMQRAIETVIDKLALAATSEDVSEFLQSHFADLAEQRGAMITGAIEAAQLREAGGVENGRAGGQRPNDDVGFAPTILSSAQPEVGGPEAARLAPANRNATTVRRSPPPSKEDSKLTLGSAALEMEEAAAGLPKRRGWLWALPLVGVAVGGWYGWKMHGLERVRALLAPQPSPVVSSQETPTPSPVPSAHPASAPPPAASALPIGTPAPAAPPAASTTIVKSPPARTPHLGVGVRSGGKGVKGASSTPTAAAAPPVPPPEPPPPAPAPTPATEEDNPYH